MAPTSKQRDPSKHPWRYTGIAKGGLFKDIKQIPFDPKVDVPHGHCFNCWEFGHSRQYCTLPDCQDHCRNCGRIGAKLKSCPRCSEAYFNFWKTKDPQNKIKGLILELAKVRKVEKWSKDNDKIGCLYFNNVKPIPFDPALDIPYKTCNDCWKPRHSGSCNLRSHNHCFNCGRIGVHMGTCPRCSDAYSQYCEKKIKNGINLALPMVDNNLLKVKEQEFTKLPPKPSAPTIIAPASTGARSFSSVLKSKDEGYASQTASFSSGINAIEQKSTTIPSRISQIASPASVDITVLDRSPFVESNSIYKFTPDYYADFKTLLTRINQLSITNQNIIVLHFITDRQAHIEQLKYQKKTEKAKEKQYYVKGPRSDNLQSVTSQITGINRLTGVDDKNYDDVIIDENEKFQ